MSLKKYTFPYLLIIVCLSLISGACDKNSVNMPDDNIPPTTRISAQIVPLTETSCILNAEWTGEDLEGSVDAFQFAFDDTSEWFQTAFPGSSFVFTDETMLGKDVSTNGGGFLLTDVDTPRYHTLFVRAVDNRGDVDPTPGCISWTLLNIVPTTTITNGPPFMGVSGPSVCIHWEGFDANAPDNQVATFDYFHSTIGVLKSEYGYDHATGITPALWRSLDWIRVNAETTQVTLTGLETGGGDNRHFFAVRSIDKLGMVDYRPEMMGNYTMWAATDDSPGAIIIRSNIMGLQHSNDQQNPHLVFAGTRCAFSWNAYLGIYGGIVTGYSYAYDSPIFSPWDLDSTRFPSDGEFVPTLGQHVFFVRAIDEAGLITEAEFQFEVVNGPGSVVESNILMIQDFHVEGAEDYYPSPEKFREFWEDSLLINFQSEIYDPIEEPAADPPILELSSASSAILTLHDGEFEPTATATWHLLNKNPLWSYVDAGGNLLVCGFYPPWVFLPDNDFLDTGAVPIRDPCFWWYSPTACGSNLIWYNPVLEDSFPHPLYEFCALETTWLDQNTDFLWSARAEQPFLPDLHIDSTRSGFFANNTHGLWWCGRQTFRDDREVDLLYSYSRTADPADAEDPVGIWIHSPDGQRGEIVYLSMPLYFFRPDEAKELVESILIQVFGETTIE